MRQDNAGWLRRSKSLDTGTSQVVHATISSPPMARTAAFVRMIHVRFNEKYLLAPAYGIVPFDYKRAYTSEQADVVGNRRQDLFFPHRKAVMRALKVAVMSASCRPASASSVGTIANTLRLQCISSWLIIAGRLGLLSKFEGGIATADNRQRALCPRPLPGGSSPPGADSGFAAMGENVAH